MSLAIFARPVANMCVVAGTFFALHGRVDDPGVRGAIAWTAGPVAMEIFRFAVAKWPYAKVASPAASSVLSVPASDVDASSKVGACRRARALPRTARRRSRTTVAI